MSNEYEQIGSGMPDGEQIGVSGGKIAFFGATPATQTLVGTIATTVPTSTSPYGFTSAQAQSILSAIIDLQTKGLVGSV